MTQETDLSLAEMENLHAELDKKIKERRQLEREAALIEISSIAARYGITVMELAKHLKPSKTPKYKDPVSGKTWSGRGRPPLWLNGKNPADFLIPPGDSDPDH